MLQTHVTTLAIVSGNILRDMYFSEEFRLSVCRQYKNELDAWTASLPNPLRQHVESGMLQGLSKDQAEAAVSPLPERMPLRSGANLLQRNLHFMLLGARILLNRPLLVKAIKSGMSSTRFTGPIVSAVTSDAIAWYVLLQLKM
jgi:hypothetical protein